MHVLELILLPIIVCSDYLTSGLAEPCHKEELTWCRESVRTCVCGRRDTSSWDYGLGSFQFSYVLSVLALRSIRVLYTLSRRYFLLPRAVFFRRRLILLAPCSLNSISGFIVAKMAYVTLYTPCAGSFLLQALVSEGQVVQGLWN